MNLLLGVLGMIGGLLCAIGDSLQLPAWCALLTSVPFMVVGIVLRLIKKERFNDLPGIIMPSMGISMVGLLAAINTIL